MGYIGFTMSRNYEWDPDKQRENFDKHGVDFADIPNFDWEGSTILRSDRQGETRFIAYGYVDARLHAVVFVIRGSVWRIISFRRANRREVNRYG